MQRHEAANLVDYLVTMAGSGTGNIATAEWRDPLGTVLGTGLTPTLTLTPGVYALTLLSAPVFGAVWVPVYALGVWALLDRLF